MPMAGSNTTSQPVNANSQNNAGGGGAVNNNNNNNTTNNTVGSNKTWELSDYELHRTPQDALTDGSEIAVSPRALHSELMCPICLDMLHQTMTTKECLHRFCAECIITALRSGNKECPTCRKKLVSKRSLRPDPNFDMLISKIYPSRDEYEAQQQKAMARLSKSHNQLALASSIEEGMKAQSQLRKVQKPGTGTKGSGHLNSSINENPEGGSSNTAGEGSAPINSNNNVAGGGQFNSSTSHHNLQHLHHHHQGHSFSDPIATNGQNSNPNQQLPSAVSSHTTTPVPFHSIAVGNANNNNNTGVGASHVIGPSPAKISRTDSAGGDNSSNTSGFSEEVTEVELVFKPHPDMIISNSAGISSAQNQTRYIKTTANASVEHLTKYLGMRLALDSQPDSTNTSMLHNFTIYVSTNGSNFVTIPQNQTLSQVCEKYWRFNKPLEMYYSWKKM